MLKNLRPYKATTDYVTTMHYSANAAVYYCTTECYVATVHYSLGVFATVCYSQNWGLLMLVTGCKTDLAR